MKDYQRIITEPIQFLTVDQFEIHQEVNEHAIMKYSGLIEDQNEEEYLLDLSQDTWMSVEAQDSDGERQTLFYGFITAYTFEHIGTDTKLSVECMSGTCLLDITPRLRTYQNVGKTYNDILTDINCQYQDTAVIIGPKGEGADEDLAIQYYETDWEFLKRMSGRIGCCLTAACHIKGIRYYWGMPELDSHDVEIGKRYRIEKHVDDHLRKECGGENLAVIDSTTYIIENRQIYRIGEYIRFHGQDLFIYRIETRYHSGECIHTYYLRTPNGNTTDRLPLPAMVGVSLIAVVTAVKQDVVQVKVHGDENQATDNVRWFPYSTVYSSADGTGWYCMPEIGDEVRLHIPSGREEEAYIISAVHLKSESSRQNPDHKSVKNKYGKEILFTPESLILTNNNGLRIELSDRYGILIESDRKIQITSAGELIMDSENASVTITTEDQIYIRQGGTCLELNDDISFTGGEFKML